MLAYLRTFIRDDRAQDLIEYALLTALISIIAIATLDAIGDDLVALYEIIQEEVEASGSAS